MFKHLIRLQQPCYLTFVIHEKNLHFNFHIRKAQVTRRCSIYFNAFWALEAVSVLSLVLFSPARLVFGGIKQIILDLLFSFVTERIE